MHPDELSGQPRVFCIGFHKTGTKSLGKALGTLGYRVAGPNGTLDPDIARNALPMALEIAAHHDAFQDNPWPVLFREMDAHFPGSRFIMSLRDPTEWITSVVRHFGDQTSPMREWIYGPGAGAPAGNEARYLQRHAAHVDAVRTHFRHRPPDLLEVQLANGDGWKPICAFLRRPVPDSPFPHVNRAAGREVRR